MQKMLGVQVATSATTLRTPLTAGLVMKESCGEKMRSLGLPTICSNNYKTKAIPLNYYTLPFKLANMSQLES